MKDELITEKTLVLTRKKGFNIEGVNTPTQSLLHRWLRDIHFWYVLVIPTVTGHFTFKLLDIQLDPENEIERPPYSDVHSIDYNNYEGALEAGLEKALTIINKGV